MNFSVQQLGIGALAGVATAMLSVGMASGSALGLFAYFLSAFPLMVAGLGWGFVAAIVAAASAALFSSFMISPSFTAVLGATTLLPSLTAVWYFALARPAEEIGGPEGKLAWFPLADTLLRTAGAVAAGFIVTGALIGYGPQFIRANVDLIVERMRTIDPQFQPSPGFEDSMTSLLTVVLPFFQTGFWFAVLAANLYLAAKLARTSGRFARPADNWPLTLRLPQRGLIAFGIALAAAFIPGSIGHAAAAVAGALAAGFVMAGLARVHSSTRGKPWRPVAIWVAYVLVLFFLPALVAFLIAGLMETGRFVPVSDTGGAKSSQSNT